VTESVQDLVTVMDDVTAAISSVIDGKTEQIETALVILLAVLRPVIRWARTRFVLTDQRLALSV